MQIGKFNGKDCYRQHVTVPVKIKEFSKKSRAKNEVFSNANIDESPTSFLQILVFPNGLRERNSGYVSLQLIDRNNAGIIEGACLISIVDASHNNRFPRTFEFGDAFSTVAKSTSKRFIVIERYISHYTLLEDAEEWLPDDTLTMQIDIYVANFVLKNYFMITGWSDPMRNVIFGSEFERLLCKESEYFKRILKNENYANISDDEVSIFIGIGSILVDKKPIEFESVEDIIKMYMTADKYHITTVSKICLHFLNLCRSDFDEEFSELAEQYECLNLLELTECLRNKSEGTLESQILVYGIGWSYRRHDKNSYLLFENKTAADVNQKECEFDFLK